MVSMKRTALTLHYQTNVVFKVFSSRVLIHTDKLVKISKREVSLVSVITSLWIHRGLRYDIAV